MNTIKMPKIGISGKVLQWEVINADGSVDQSCYRPSDNIILDSGLDFITIASANNIDYLSYYFCIGTGTTEPSATDTTLTAETYRSTCMYDTYHSTTYSPNESDPYYIYRQRGVQTTLGALNGTYGEIGFAPYGYSTINSGLFSKHRLKDESGNPTTITVSSSQQLRLKYVITFHISPSTITTGTINVSGIGNIDYEAKWQYTELKALEYHLSGPYIIQFNYGNFNAVTSPITFDNIGATPIALSAANRSQSITQPSYVTGSYENYRTANWTVDQCNATWYGIALASSPLNYPMFVVKFATQFVKANTHAISFTMKVSWGRA